MLLAGCGGSLAARVPAELRGSWTGSYLLAGRDSVAFVIGRDGVVVALGESHAGAQRAQFTVRSDTLSVSIPGLPTDVVFAVRRDGERLVGTATQGTLRGAVSAARGSATARLAPGFYRAGSRMYAVVDDPYGPPRLDDLATGEVHGLFPGGMGIEIGHGFATRDPVAGRARFGAQMAVIDGKTAARVPLRQYEVRFPSGSDLLAGTLTLPRGSPPYPAVAFVTGSGPTVRAYLPDLQALLVESGVAVLSYDKRGVGQSGGTYPGESATDSTLAILARDAVAGVRFLARQPEIDRRRIGLAGHSQAGWIMPLAARLEPKIRFMVSFSGPAVTPGESDVYQTLTGEGENHTGHTPAQIEADVARFGPSGFDPLPSIRRDRIPMLFVYGGLDQHIPARLSLKRLRPIASDRSRDVTVVTFPKANHALVQTSTGLTSEMLRSDRFAPGLFATVRRWLARHVLAA